MFEIHGHHGQSPKFSLFNAFLCDNFFESGHETLKLRKSHGHWFLNMATLATPWPQLATLVNKELISRNVHIARGNSWFFIQLTLQCLLGEEWITRNFLFLFFFLFFFLFSFFCLHN